MLRRRLFAGLATLGVVFATAVLPAQADGPRPDIDLGTPSVAAPPGPKITIDLVTANGSGCKKDTIAVAMSDDNTAMTMTFSDYIAKVGAGIPLIEARKNCQMALRLNVPSGFTYGIVQADYRGYAQIAAGATGQQRASYYYQGQSMTARAWSPINGPFDGDFIFTDKVPVADVVWAPCKDQRLLNINTELRLNKGTSTAESFMTTDSADTSVNTLFHFAWKACPTN